MIECSATGFKQGMVLALLQAQALPTVCRRCNTVSVLQIALFKFREHSVLEHLLVKITYSAAISLDGFIATEKGDVDWLDAMKIDAAETGLEEFFAGVDGLVMGRNTYDFVYNHGAWPYEDKPTWVCTHRSLQSLDGAQLIVVDAIEAVLSDAATRGLEHLWLVGGGQLASSFLSKDLITTVSLSEMPIQLGSGIPVFADYQLKDIRYEARNVVNKAGFRQIDITVKRRT